MTCQCKHQFCYKCLKNWNGGRGPHGNTVAGPCSNFKFVRIFFFFLKKLFIIIRDQNAFDNAKRNYAIGQAEQEWRRSHPNAIHIRLTGI
jgi:hypothetical protein